jgi:diguanylate cyclase (GGDEF)-like protein
MLVVAETYGFCAGMVSRGFVRPKLCALMVLLGALPTGAGLLLLATRSTGATAISYGLVGALFVLYAVSSLETVNHLYKAMIAQITIKHHFATVARTDALTGLANRVAMSELLMEVQTHASDASALLLIDLDGFKAVNDRLGHPAGDQLLKSVARSISGTLRPGDFAVRMGGDEFAIVQRQSPGPHETLALAERIIRSIASLSSGSNVDIGASIGIATFEGMREDPDVVIDRADRALYRAKRAGGNVVRTWREEPALAMVA